MHYLEGEKRLLAIFPGMLTIPPCLGVEREGGGYGCQAQTMVAMCLHEKYFLLLEIIK